MKFERRIKETFVVIGKEGSTADGGNFIPQLWAWANANFGEVQHLAKKDAAGNLAGIWGTMSDFSRAFNPWEDNFTKGLYLAGVECVDGAEAPAGWMKWIVPGYEYLCVENDGDAFPEALAYMAENDIPLVGAVHDFTDTSDGKNYLFFPVRKL